MPQTLTANITAKFNRDSSLGFRAGQTFTKTVQLPIRPSFFPGSYLSVDNERIDYQATSSAWVFRGLVAKIPGL
ncbi:hypothetical protein, partial [Acinetobacter baylyi]|uniref:hypothetical protein n=1 Tax=Acinetobacter baylyi TaxID=202950 RepID=UPI001C0895E6